MEDHFHPGVQVPRKLCWTWPLFALLVLISCGCGGADSEQEDVRSKAAQESEATSGPDLSDPEKMAIAILDTLIRGDKEAYTSFACLPKDEILKRLQERIKGLESDPNEASALERLRREVAEFDEEYQERVEDVVEDWEEILEKGQRDGVDWSEARFVRADFQIKEIAGPDGRKVRSARDVDVYFQVDGKTFRLGFDQAMEFNGSWYAGDLDYYGQPRN